MVSGEEAYRLVVESSLGVEVAKFLRDVVVEYVRVVFFYDALEGRNRFEPGTVGRGVAFDVPVRDTEGQVRIWVEDFFLVEFHLAFHVLPVGQAYLLVEAVHYGFDICLEPFPEGIGHLIGRIGFDLVLVIGTQCEYFVTVSEQ